MAKPPAWKPSTLAEAKRGRLMELTAPSGARFVVRALTIDELATADGLPDDLLRIALLEGVPGGVVSEIASKLGDPTKLREAQELSRATVKLRDRLVLEAVVQPRLAAKDLTELDPFDKDMIAQACQRKIVFDAAGRRIGSDALATFRELAQELGCDPDSEAFARAVRTLAGVQ